MMEFRPVKLVLITSLADEDIGILRGPKDRALKALKEMYPVDFGYNPTAWFMYAIKNDKKFIEELYNTLGFEPDMDVRLLLTKDGWNEFMSS